MSTGIVKEVMGAVVDIAFPAGQLPEIYNALKIKSEDQDNEESKKLDRHDRKENPKIKRGR